MKIGILVGMENTFPPALIEKINGLDAGVTAEYVKIGGVKMGEANDYRVIFDRISHEIPFYRSYLKNAVLNGAITLDAGRVEQRNFDGYDVLRIDEMLRVEVHIMPSSEPPTGVGEPGVPPIGPAVGNALAALTGGEPAGSPQPEPLRRGGSDRVSGSPPDADVTRR